MRSPTIALAAAACLAGYQSNASTQNPNSFPAENYRNLISKSSQILNRNQGGRRLQHRSTRSLEDMNLSDYSLEFDHCMISWVWDEDMNEMDKYDFPTELAYFPQFAFFTLKKISSSETTLTTDVSTNDIESEIPSEEVEEDEDDQGEIHLGADLQLYLNASVQYYYDQGHIEELPDLGCRSVTLPESEENTDTRKYWVAPICSPYDDLQINMGLYSDHRCSVPASEAKPASYLGVDDFMLPADQGDKIQNTRDILSQIYDLYSESDSGAISCSVSEQQGERRRMNNNKNKKNKKHNDDDDDSGEETSAQESELVDGNSTNSNSTHTSKNGKSDGTAGDDDEKSEDDDDNTDDNDDDAKSEDDDNGDDSTKDGKGTKDNADDDDDSDQPETLGLCNMLYKAAQFEGEEQNDDFWEAWSIPYEFDDDLDDDFRGDIDDDDANVEEVDYYDTYMDEEDIDEEIEEVVEEIIGGDEEDFDDIDDDAEVEYYTYMDKEDVDEVIEEVVEEVTKTKGSSSRYKSGDPTAAASDESTKSSSTKAVIAIVAICAVTLVSFLVIQRVNLYNRVVGGGPDELMMYEEAPSVTGKGAPKAEHLKDQVKAQNTVIADLEYKLRELEGKLV